MIDNPKQNVYFSADTLIEVVEEILQLVDLFLGVLNVL
jgi:hypothetical protein